LLKAQNINSSESKSLQEILNGIQKVEDKMQLIYDLDVLDYYELTDKYNTDLKREMFMKTSEYSSKLEDLKKKKADLLSHQIYISDYYSHLKDYNIKRKGFDIYIGEVSLFICDNAIKDKTIEWENKFKIYLEPLPIYISKSIIFQQRYLFIPINEEKGLEIENNIENIKVYFIFKIADKTIQLKYIPCDIQQMQENIIKTNEVRIIVANEETGKVYFDKKYLSISKSQ